MSVAERERALTLLHDAVHALEAGNETDYRRHLDALSTTRSQPMMDTLARLARELNQTLGGISSEIPPDPALNELPDAGARLEHVVRMTEEASHQTLDLTERCRALVDALQSRPLDAEATSVVTQLRTHLSEIALAQAYQDLTGQVIRRVVNVVTRVQATLGTLPPPVGQAADPGGPRLAGLDRPAVSQVDADELLSGLGL